MGDLLGVSQNTLADLVRRQIAIKTRRNEYDMRATVRAYTAHLREMAAARAAPTKTLTLERERLIREQADREALRNRQRRGELLDAAAVERNWTELFSYVRGALLAIPSRLSHLTPQDAAVVDREIRDALTRIGSGDL